MRPRKQRQAQVDSGRVQSIDRVGQLQAQAVVGIKVPRLGDQPVGELRVNAPVAQLVGIGQRRTPHRFAKAHVVELRGLSRQADFDIAQALSIGQLRKRHRPILLGTAQCSHPSVAIVTYNNPCEGAPGQKIHELSEKRFAGVHERLLGKIPNSAQQSSNRHHRFSPATSCQISSFLNALRGQPDSSDITLLSCQDVAGRTRSICLALPVHLTA